MVYQKLLKPSKLNNIYDYLFILFVRKGILTKQLEIFHHSSFSLNPQFMFVQKRQKP